MDQCSGPPYFLILVYINEITFWENKFIITIEGQDCTIEELFQSQIESDVNLRLVSKYMKPKYQLEKEVSGKSLIRNISQLDQKETVKITIKFNVTFIVRVMLDNILTTTFVLRDLPLNLDLQLFFAQAKLVAQLPKGCLSPYDEKEETIIDMIRKKSLEDLNYITIVFSQIDQQSTKCSITSTSVKVVIQQTQDEHLFNLDNLVSIGEFIDQITKKFQLKYIQQYFFEFKGENLQWKNQQANLDTYGINSGDINVISTKNNLFYLSIFVGTVEETKKWIITKKTTFHNLSDYLIDYYNKNSDKQNTQWHYNFSYPPCQRSLEYKRDEIILEKIQPIDKDQLLILANYVRLL